MKKLRLCMMFLFIGLAWLSSHVSAQSNMTIDFTFLQVPEEIQTPIRQAMQANEALLPAINRFTVSFIRQSGEWLSVVLVPTAVIESGWETELQSNEIIEILARKEDSFRWSSALWGTESFAQLAENVPGQFMESTTMNALDQFVADDYLFPWTDGQCWAKTQNWHEGNALDFAPTTNSNPSITWAVLAAKVGRFTVLCNDGYQASAKIQHADGTTQYLHIAANSFRSDLNGKDIVRGQYLGILYNGTDHVHGACNPANFQCTLQWNTACGCGCPPSYARHLHFVLPSQTITINGYNASSIPSSACSSNVRVDSACGPNLCDNVGGCTLTAGTYNLTCPIYVNAGQTLHIMPGVTLNYNGYSFTVNGQLIWGP